MTDTPKNGPCSALRIFTEESASQPEQLAPDDIDPLALLDVLIAKTGLPNDAALARRLQVTESIIKLIRNGKLSVSPSLILRWAEATTGISVEELRRLMRSKKGGPSGTAPN